MSQPKVSILIVTYNRWDLLAKCLDSIRQQSYKEIETIVVDNGSDVETKHCIKDYPWVRYLSTKTNLGFTGGNNLAAKHATGEYLFLLNNDAFLGWSTLEEVVAYTQTHSEIAVAQPTILIHQPNGKATKSNGAGSFLTQWGFLWHRCLREPITDLPKQPDYIFSALGAGMLVRNNVVKDNGLLDETFFAYFEETDFCWRLWTRGWKVAYVPTNPMTHLGGQTSKAFKEKMAIYISSRNRLVSIWRHLDGQHFWAIIIRNHIAILGLAVVLLPKRPKASGWFMATIAWELTHLRYLFHTRQMHLAKRTVPDQDIWPEMFRSMSLGRMAKYLR